MPRQSLLVQLVHEWVGVKLLHVVHSGFVPQSECKHPCADACRHAGGVANTLHAGLLVGSLVRAVVINIVGVLLAVKADTANAATDACLAVVVFAEVLRIGQHGLEELQRHNLHCRHTTAVGKGCLILHLVDAAHADVLYHVEVGQVLLPEGHPETCPLDGREVDDQALYLLVVEQVALLRPDVGVGEGLVYLHRLSLDVFAVLVVEALLRYLADVYLGVEIGGEGLVVVAGIAVHDVKVVNLLEMVLGGIGGEDAGHAWVEAAAQYGAEARFLKALTVCPLP